MGSAATRLSFGGELRSLSPQFLYCGSYCLAKKHEETRNKTKSHVDSSVAATTAALGTRGKLKDIKRHFFVILMDMG
jgi:hypothetical protein